RRARSHPARPPAAGGRRARPHARGATRARPPHRRGDRRAGRRHRGGRGRRRGPRRESSLRRGRAAGETRSGAAGAAPRRDGAGAGRAGTPRPHRRRPTRGCRSHQRPPPRSLRGWRMTQRSVVVATAGHVDHGKSTLVRALTGMDPDRLQAERERGLTIELGFTWADFAGTTIAFVDVPGHEKFITPRRRGAGSVPLAVSAVAGDDPWRPQAGEHLAALAAVGTREAIFAITRCDLADPGAALDRVREEIAGTSLAGARVLPVSAVTGEGMAPLREALADLGAAAPQADVAADVRVWIDRRFTVAGAGTVVTGTLPAGVIAAGAELRGPGGSVRVRSLESLNAPRDRVTGSTRVALNLTGAVEGLGRGDALWQPGAWHLTDVVDVRLLTGAGRVPRTPMWHIGSRATQVRMQLLDGSHARLALPDPVPLRQGDRTVLRDPGDRRLWGALVVDPDPAPLRSLARRSGLRPRLARARELRARGAEPDLEVEVRARGVVHRDTLRR